MKLSCCLIIRNEAANLARCLQSVRPHVDELCVLDTGSTDGSPLIAQDLADKWEQWTGCNDAEGHIRDFSAARNRNLAQASPGNAVLWLDGDDELVGGEHLRRLASEAPRGPGGGFGLLAPYEYDFDDQGRCTTLQWRERLVGPVEQWEWRGPVHEGLLGRAGSSPIYTPTDMVRVVHRRRAVGKAIDSGRNLRILRAWFEQHGEADQRLMHYFGAELLLNKHVGEAMYWLRRHAAVAPWSDERCLSLLHLARVHMALGDGEYAAKYALEATQTKTWPEPYWLLGQAYCMMADQGIDRDHNLRRGAYQLERGFKVGGGGAARTLLMSDPTIVSEAHAWFAAACERLGKWDEALEHGRLALAGLPERADLREAVGKLEAEQARNHVRSSVVKLHELGALSKAGGVAIEQVLRGNFQVDRVSDPRSLEVVPSATSQAIHLSGSAGRSDKLRIAFWLGHASGEPWTPDTLKRDGGGGSETMAWEMAKRLAAKGHTVHVFAHCDPLSDGGWFGDLGARVFWVDAAEFNQLDGSDYDVLIVSRAAAAVTLPHRAKARVLWVHDVHCGPDLTPQIAVQFDFVWCLSNWHKQHFCSVYPWLNPDKVEVTRNGIDPGRFARTDVVRNPHRAIYSSSPDRGLAEAVAAWPTVRAAIPDAELHVYYGFEGWERALVASGELPYPHGTREAKTRLVLACQTTEGVVLHGKVSQDELTEAMLSSGVWFYPTWFSETSCITAMEAQAAGLWCVCPPIAALAETAHPSTHCYWSEDYAAEVVKCMRATTTDFYYDGEKGRAAKLFDLDTLADAWELRLAELVSGGGVPKFHEARNEWEAAQ